MPVDEADKKEELPEQLNYRQNEDDSLDDDPTWSPEELERAYKAMKDDDDDSPSTNENPRYLQQKTLNTSNILNNIPAIIIIVAFQCNTISLDKFSLLKNSCLQENDNNKNNFTKLTRRDVIKILYNVLTKLLQILNPIYKMFYHINSYVKKERYYFIFLLNLE